MRAPRGEEPGAAAKTDRPTERRDTVLAQKWGRAKPRRLLPSGDAGESGLLPPRPWILSSKRCRWKRHMIPVGVPPGVTPGWHLERLTAACRGLSKETQESPRAASLSIMPRRTPPTGLMVPRRLRHEGLSFAGAKGPLPLGASLAYRRAPAAIGRSKSSQFAATREPMIDGSRRQRRPATTSYVPPVARLCGEPSLGIRSSPSKIALALVRPRKGPRGST